MTQIDEDINTFCALDRKLQVENSSEWTKLGIFTLSWSFLERNIAIILSSKLNSFFLQTNRGTWSQLQKYLQKVKCNAKKPELILTDKFSLQPQ